MNTEKDTTLATKVRKRLTAPTPITAEIAGDIGLVMPLIIEHSPDFKTKLIAITIGLVIKTISKLFVKK